MRPGNLLGRRSFTESLSRLTYEARAARLVASARRRYESAPTTLVEVEDPRVPKVSQADKKELTMLKLQERRNFVSAVFFFVFIVPTGVSLAFALLPTHVLAVLGLMAVVYLPPAAAYAMLELADFYDRVDALEQPVLLVPSNVKDAWEQIRSGAESDSAPDWVRSTALYGDDVLVDIAAHQLGSTMNSRECRELVAALFTAAARVDVWCRYDKAPPSSASAELVLETSAQATDQLNL